MTAKQAAAAQDELTALALRGCFRTDVPVPDPAKAPRKYLLYVNLSVRCNLRCRYCYVGHDARNGSPMDRQPLDMSPRTMEAAARFIGEAWDASLLDAPYVGIASSGEPACQLDLYDRFSGLLEAESRARGVRFRASAWSSTNMTLLADPDLSERVLGMDPDWLTSDGPPRTLECDQLSLDGPPGVHDAMRVHPDGGGTYDDTMRALAAGRGPTKANATLTGAYPDAAAVYRHLLGLGFARVCVKPVRARPEEPHSIAQNLRAVCDGYTGLADWLLSSPDDQLSGCLQRIAGVAESGDYFGRFLARVSGRHLRRKRCNGGTSELLVHTDGQLYVCPGLAGVPEARLGSVWEGIDDVKVEHLAATPGHAPRPLQGLLGTLPVRRGVRAGADAGRGRRLAPALRVEEGCDRMGRRHAPALRSGGNGRRDAGAPGGPGLRGADLTPFPSPRAERGGPDQEDSHDHLG